MATRKKPQKPEAAIPVEMEVLEIQRGVIECCLLGETDIVYNAMSYKAKQELLAPKPKATGGAKRQALERSRKHDPLQEYNASVYRTKDETSPTALTVPASWFKGAMAAASLDLPGATKAQIGRLVTVMGHELPLFGIPELWMARVTQAGISRTPDIRTRARVPAPWACRVSVRYVKPMLTERTVFNLLAAAGTFIGVGDYRQGKGAGNCGLFRIVSPDDAEFQRVVKDGGAVAQRDALENPQFFDDETDRLYAWYVDEMARRENEGQMTPDASAPTVEAPQEVM